MATKLVPIPAGKPGKQLDIFDEIVNKQEEKDAEHKPVQHPQPLPNQKGTNQALRYTQ